jgi:hypothetical protein
MSTRTRIAITVASTLAVGAASYGGRYGITLPGLLEDPLGKSFLFVYALAAIVAFFVNRWWALLPAAAPAAVTFYLYNLTDYSTPWDSEGIGPWNGPFIYGFLVLLGICMMAVPFAFALGARRLWDRFRSTRRADLA